MYGSPPATRRAPPATASFTQRSTFSSWSRLMSEPICVFGSRMSPRRRLFTRFTSFSMKVS